MWVYLPKKQKSRVFSLWKKVFTWIVIRFILTNLPTSSLSLYRWPSPWPLFQPAHRPPRLVPSSCPQICQLPQSLDKPFFMTRHRDLIRWCKHSNLLNQITSNLLVYKLQVPCKSKSMDDWEPIWAAKTKMSGEQIMNIYLVLGRGSNNQNGNLRWILPWRGGLACH